MKSTFNCLYGNTFNSISIPLCKGKVNTQFLILSEFCLLFFAFDDSSKCVMALKNKQNTPKFLRFDVCVLGNF